MNSKNSTEQTMILKHDTKISRRTFTKSLIAVPFAVRAQQNPLRARVKIDSERIIGDIDPKIYGNFIEHLGRRFGKAHLAPLLEAFCELVENP